LIATDHIKCKVAGKQDNMQSVTANLHLTKRSKILMTEINKQRATAKHAGQTNWDDLRIFLTVARHSNLDVAATFLHQDPTTLGRRIRRLEDSIGATLFDRSRRGHLLTSSGEWLLDQVEQIDHIMSDIDTSISGEIKKVGGTVRLSVTEAFGNLMVAPSLIDLTSAYPDLRIELVATSGILSVSKREADMAVLLSRPTRGRLKVSKLTDYQLKLYATPAYLTKHEAITKLSQLNQHNLIGYVDDLIYSPSLRYYDEIASGLTPNLTSSSLLAQAQLAISGSGIAMLPRFVGEQRPELCLVLADDVTITRSFWLAIHEDIFDHARIQAVLKFLQTLAVDQAGLLQGNRPA
jgi:DNA-binding transcriptional LysR family regulator